MEFQKEFWGNEEYCCEFEAFDDNFLKSILTHLENTGNLKY